ncbi:hypothetical protein CY35_06G059200 [Sphagnum magellanicum]|nr:hypothetical protein CY35_06G059200 [Sphagnum magellanicum]KAH9559456.1 hypothetical protein CY35_06G059200 [Sphagnum magellanicum]
MARPSYMSSEPNSISKHHEVAIAIPDDTVLEEPVDNWSAKERSNLYSDLYNCESTQMGAAEKNINTSNPSSNVVTLVMPHTTHGRKPPVPIILKFVDVRSKVTIADQAAAAVMCWRRWPSKRKSSSSSSNLQEMQQNHQVAATSVARKKVEKTILDGVTGMVKPGEMLAIMGPSGSGKTTLLNALAARGLHAGVSGTISYNDLPYHKALKRRMGFVTQDDVLFPNLTVRETLMYAALLRLPNSLTRSQKISRAQDCIVDLGLERCQNTIIGGPFLRGISGGERKRVCIGHEILVDPSLLYLDEPTSGLDSTIALRIIQVIKSIAQTGRTVLTTIHQPSSRLFHMFDKLILLSEGHTIYFGNARAASDYFSTKLGLVPQIPMNPADFVLDLASGNVNDVLMPLSLTQRAIKRQSSAVSTTTQKQPPTITKLDVQEFLVDSYHQELAPKEETILQADSEITKEMRLATLEKMERSATWVQQFMVLLVRGLKERRHDYLNWLKFVQVVTLSVIVGLLWWQSKLDTETELSGQLGLVFFIAIFWGMYPLFTAIFSFPLERAMLMKERASDLYSLTAYFFARTLGDLPLDLVLPSIFLIIVYFMTNLRRTAGAFLLSVISVYLFVIAAQGLGFLLGAAMMDVKKASTLASIIMLTFMLTGGFFVQSIPVWINWLKYLSINNYSYRLLIKVQYSRNAQYGCGSSTGCQSIATSSAFRGISLGGGGVEVGALCLMLVVFRFLAYIALRRMKSRK